MSWCDPLPCSNSSNANITVAHYYYSSTSNANYNSGTLLLHCRTRMPLQKRVKSVVTHTSKRRTQEKSTPVPPKKPKKSAGDKGMQGRPELQITVPADSPQGQPSLVQLTLNQTVTTAPMQPLTLQPNGAVQGTVAWSPLLGPVTTTSATWQQPVPQQHFGWQQLPNLIPPWPASWNPNTGAYNIQH